MEHEWVESTYTLIPEGQYSAKCVRVIEAGTHQSVFPNKDTGKDETVEQVRLILTFEVINKETKEHCLIDYTLWNFKLSKSSNATKLITSWLGTKTIEKIKESGKFSTKDFLGKDALIAIRHEEKKDSTRAIINSVSELPEEMKSIQAENKLIYWDIDCGEPPKELGDFIVGKLKESKEWTEKNETEKLISGV